MPKRPIKVYTKSTNDIETLFENHKNEFFYNNVISEDTFNSWFGVTPPTMTGNLAIDRPNLSKYGFIKLGFQQAINSHMRSEGFYLKSENYGTQFRVLNPAEIAKEVDRYKNESRKLASCAVTLKAGNRNGRGQAKWESVQY